MDEDSGSRPLLSCSVWLHRGYLDTVHIWLFWKPGKAAMKNQALWITSHNWSGSVKGLKTPERKWWSTGLLQSDFLLSPARNLKTAPRPGACGPLPKGRAGRLMLGVPVGGGKFGP